MPTFKVATINLRNRSDRWHERRHVLLNALLEADADLISLQEISFLVRQGEWLRDELNARLPVIEVAPYTLVQRRKGHLIWGILEGIGILSRLPILSQDAIPLGHGGRVALRATVELPSGHMLDFVATHLHHLKRDREARLEQAMTVVSWLSGPGRVPYQVIGGDFNEIPSGPAVQHMKQSYLSAYEQANGFEPLATYPTALVPPGDGWTGCIDYLFITSTIKVQNAQICCNQPSPDDNRLYPSDHVGIVATLEIAPE